VIPKRQDEIDALTRKYLTKPNTSEALNGHRPPAGTVEIPDAEIIALCRKAKNAAKFADLFDAGNTAANNNNDSEADLALLGILKFYTQDYGQLERIFGVSALGQRSKWGKRADYRKKTIDKALSHVGGTYPKPQGEVRSHSHSLGKLGSWEVRDYEDDNDLKQSIQALSFSGREKPSPRDWIVDGYIPKGHSTAFYGAGGTAKSLLALHLALTVADEKRDYWLGRKVKHVPVLYLDFELDADEQHRRALELVAGMGFGGVPEDFYYLAGAGLGPLEAFAAAAAEIARLGAGLVVVDSIGFALAGDSEAARDVLAFDRTCLQPLKNAGSTPLLIDHQAKVIKGEKYADKEAFGSVYKGNTARSSFQVRGAWEPGEVTATLVHKKNSFGPKGEDFSVKLVFERDRIMVERLADAVKDPDKEVSKKEQVLEAVTELGRATAETVARKTGHSLKTVQNRIAELVAEGELEDTGEKQGRQRIVVPKFPGYLGNGNGNFDQAVASEENADHTPREMGVEDAAEGRVGEAF
jgi:hypothetical protein